MKTKALKQLAVFFLFFLASSSNLLNAQNEGERFREQSKELEVKRIAFITRELSLTPSEAQVFWPVYNEYNQRRNEMMMRHRSMRMKEHDIERMSESELVKLADADIRNMEEMIALRREYHEKFKTVLPLKKVITLYEAERKFNRQLFREGRQEQRRGRN